MNFFRQWGQFMMTGVRAMAKWEVDNANTILRDRKRLAILGLLFLSIIIYFCKTNAKPITALAAASE